MLYNIKSAQRKWYKNSKIFWKDGKIVYILQIKGMICEMPMIEIDNSGILLVLNVDKSYN